MKSTKVQAKVITLYTLRNPTTGQLALLIKFHRVCFFVCLFLSFFQYPNTGWLYPTHIKHSGCTLHSETRSGHVNLFCSVLTQIG